MCAKSYPNQDMIKTENFEKIEVCSKDQLRDWLDENHTQKDSVWLVTYKKSVFERYVSRDDVLDELLCVGWIDGIRRKLDDNRTMQLIGPRRKQHWAKTYKDRAQDLIDSGLMKPSGFESIKVSKENGLWTFMDDVDALIIPNDLEKALKEDPSAFDFFVSHSDFAEVEIHIKIKIDVQTILVLTKGI